MELYTVDRMKEEKRVIEEFCREHIRLMEQLKRDIDNCAWQDERKEELVAQMNDFAQGLAATLTVLYRVDAHKVNFFDDIIPLLEAYKETASAFDHID